MLGDTLVFLRDHLNAALTQVSGSETPVVEFVAGAETDAMKFKQDRVSALLVNVEEETTMRRPDPYTMTAADGSVRRIFPEIRMSLFVLFVARFAQYETGLTQLSRVIRHFQRHRVVDRAAAPGIPAGVEKLVLELVTMPFSEQNEIWNALRTTYLPSVLYKVKVITIVDQQPARTAAVRDKTIDVSQAHAGSGE